MVEAGLALYFSDRAEGLAIPQRAIVGHVACVVNRTMAELISQPGAWRIASLVSTARLLTPWIGLNAAALMAASSTRRYQQEWPVTGSSSIDTCISRSALSAVHKNPAQRGWSMLQEASPSV